MPKRTTNLVTAIASAVIATFGTGAHAVRFFDSETLDTSFAVQPASQSQ